MARVQDASTIEAPKLDITKESYRLFLTKQRSCTTCKRRVYVLEPPNLREALFFICFRCKKVYEEFVGEVPKGRRSCQK